MPKAPTATIALEPALFPGLVYHSPEYRLLYCRGCKAVVLSRALNRHLNTYHRCYSVAQRRLLVRHSQTLDLITNPEDLPLQPDHSPALSFVWVEQGYSCSLCRYLTTNRHQIRAHGNKEHSLFQHACTDSYRAVALQSWFIGPRAQYWVVASACTAVSMALTSLIA